MAANTSPTYYAQTLPGVEEIAWLEIRERLPEASFREYQFAKDQNGIVLFDYPGAIGDLFKLRTAEDLFVEALSVPKVSRSRGDLRQISEWIEKSDSFGRAANVIMRQRKFSEPPTYRIISRKYGRHQYRRKDMQFAVLRGVQSRLKRWTAVTTDDAQVEIWANLLGSRLLIGLRLTDRSMRHRHEKRVELPGSLRPSMAAAMVFLTEPGADDIFLDPMCGSGTILLERRFAGPYERILGGDNDPQRVDAAQQNVATGRKRRLPRSITIRQWDARSLPLDDASVDKVATNLPFGKQIGSPAALPDLYAGVLAELSRVVRPGGRIVLLTSEYDLIKESLRALPALEIQTGYSVAALGQWGRIYQIQRSAAA